MIDGVLAHFLLGIAVFAVAILIKMIDDVDWERVVIAFMGLVAVELVQAEAYGIAHLIKLDTLVDLVVGACGTSLAMALYYRFR